MKWLILAGLVFWPMVAQAQAPTKHQILMSDMEPSLSAAMIVGEVEYCGLRPEPWAKKAINIIQFQDIEYVSDLWGDTPQAMTEVQWVAKTLQNTEAFGLTQTSAPCATLEQSDVVQSLDSAMTSGN